MMMALMENGVDCEFLFTSDEEIGLIGASYIEFELKSEYMLNLDSEDEGEIYIGCAGGIDIKGTINKRQTKKNDDNLTLYEISINDLDGGHSGVDIDKEIPNAIKLVAKTIKECDGKLLDIQGGERINSIPKSCKAIIAANCEPNPSHINMKIDKVDTNSKHFTLLSNDIINFIYTFANGVRGYDNKLKVVLNSINLALVKTTVDCVEIELSARSMDNSELKRIKEETKVLLECFGFKVTASGKYPAWKPDRNKFAEKVLKIYQKHIPSSSLEAIHAGLECAIFKDKFPNIQIASIGPNINFPHSNREEVEISSIHQVYKVVEDIILTLK
jgi:dipeptidase D